MIMNDRKQKVIDTAHALFIEKGYKATSIQDILDGSGISKGTFYNYFPSKSELFIAIFKSIYKKTRIERDKVLSGGDLSDIGLFRQQLEILMHMNKQSNIFLLINEVFVSDDEDLKQFITQIQTYGIHWIYVRLNDLFGEEKKQHLLDCAIILHGMINHMNQFNALTKAGRSGKDIINYCINRTAALAGELSEREEQLFDPDEISSWLPDFRNAGHECNKRLLQSALTLKKSINKLQSDGQHTAKTDQLIDFILDELLQTSEPRRFLIDSALSSLMDHLGPAGEPLQEFRNNIGSCLQYHDQQL